MTAPPLLGFAGLGDLGGGRVVRTKNPGRDLLSLAALVASVVTGVITAVVAGCSSVAVAAQTKTAASAHPRVGLVAGR